MGRKEEKVAQIIHAATQEFLLKGIDSGSMHNIAAMAQVSKRTLYKYFSSKPELLDAIIAELLDGIHNFYQVEYNPKTLIEEQLDRIIDSKIELLSSQQYIDMSKIALGELMKSKKLNEDHLNELNKSESYFVKWITDAKKDGKITSDQDSELIASQFHSLIKGHIFYPVIFGLKELDQTDFDTARTIVKEFFFKSFVNQVTCSASARS